MMEYPNMTFQDFRLTAGMSYMTPNEYYWCAWFDGHLPEERRPPDDEPIILEIFIKPTTLEDIPLTYKDRNRRENYKRWRLMAAERNEFEAERKAIVHKTPPSFIVEGAKLKLFKDHDPNRKLKGCPSCSYEGANDDEYEEGDIEMPTELSKMSAEDIWRPFPAMRFPLPVYSTQTSTSSSTTPTSSMDSPPPLIPASSLYAPPPPRPLIPASTLPKIDSAGPCPAQTTYMPVFPDARTEHLYHYVSDVLECFRIRQDRYTTDRVLSELVIYQMKIKRVYGGFCQNAFGIRDRLPQPDIHIIEGDLEDSVCLAISYISMFEKEWSACIKKNKILARISKKMHQGFFDRNTLRKAKQLGKMLVSNLKNARDYLYCTLDKIGDIYGCLSEIRNVLNWDK